MKFEFTDDEIRLLAKAERRMDDGLIPFVMLCGKRVSVQPQVMEELNLRQGQTINDQIFMAILKHQLAWCEAQIALQKARDAAAEGREAQ